MIRLIQIFIPIFLISLTLSQASEPKLVINEFAAINDSGIQDEDGDFSDWIELHNFGTNSINLKNLSLTDNRKKLTKWKFPSIEIKGGEFLVIFMSGKNRFIPNTPINHTSENNNHLIHANFSLKGNSEYLGLVDSDGKSIIDEYSPKYPNQKKI